MLNTRTEYTSPLIFTCATLLCAQLTAVENSRENDSHWAFQPIRRLALPSVGNRSWPCNEIDLWILSRLEREAVQPAPLANRNTLQRRLHLDLVGLTPSPFQIDRFLEEIRPDAYERLVDRLLASPHYGERWGRYWLDMARYADSDGYEKDLPRPYAWRWRQWVIDTLNADKPFDQFTLEQLAGDLLEESTTEQQIATGFHRNSLVNREGGIDQEEDRVKRTVDRINTLGEVWLGMTIECAQCHDHKFDPISQHEYYSLYAFFNNLDEPNISAPLPGQVDRYLQTKQDFDREHEKLLKQLAEYERDEFPQALASWEDSLGHPAPNWVLLTPQQLTDKMGSMFSPQEDGSILVTGSNNRSLYTVVTETDLVGITAFRLEVLPDDRLPAKGPGRGHNGNFVLTKFRVTAIPRVHSATTQVVDLQSAFADFSERKLPITSVIDDDSGGGWAIYPQVGKSHTAIFETRQDIGFVGGTRLQIELHHGFHADHNIGRFRISCTTFHRPVRLGVLEALQVPRNQRNDQQRSMITNFYRTLDPRSLVFNTAVTEHAQKVPVDPRESVKAQVVSERVEPRETHIHIRGDFLHKGAVVESQTPSSLPPLQTRNGRPNRLDLARWLVDPKNPLTARVIVNRLWQQYFGRGIVATDNDFGTQGDKPTHPALLDQLATDLISKDWSLKSLHRRIVTSATYRQSSDVRLELEDRDPNNRWMARQNRLRVEAEVIRDLALAASGLLVNKIGGESVRPPQPADVAKLGFPRKVEWPTSVGSDRYRRGVYTFFQRTVPYPMLIAFDASDSNTSCTRRERSNTPLQALSLWNDPVFFEAAQALGQRIVDEIPTTGQPTIDQRQRIRHAFLLCLARQPSQEEQRVMQNLVASQRDQLAADKQAARRVVAHRAGTVPDAELGVWVIVGRTLMNTDEFITRE